MKLTNEKYNYKIDIHYRVKVIPIGCLRDKSAGFFYLKEFNYVTNSSRIF